MKMKNDNKKSNEKHCDCGCSEVKNLNSCGCSHDCDCGDDCHCDENNRCNEDCDCNNGTKERKNNVCECGEECDCDDDEDETHNCDCGEDCDCGDYCDCDEDDSEDDDSCDVYPDKICDNCGKCLDLIETKDGFAKIKIDKIEVSEDVTLDQLYKMYGLDEE